MLRTRNTTDATDALTPGNPSRHAATLPRGRPSPGACFQKVEGASFVLSEGFLTPCRLETHRLDGIRWGREPVEGPGD